GKVVSLHCARSFDNKSKSLYLSRKRSRTEFANLNLISHKKVKSMSKNNIECLFLTIVRSATDYTIASIDKHTDVNLKHILNEYKDVFPDDLPIGLPPSREIDHRVELIPGSVPPSRATYRMSPKELDELKRQLQELTDHGFIQPSKSPY